MKKVLIISAIVIAVLVITWMTISYISTSGDENVEGPSFFAFPSFSNEDEETDSDQEVTTDGETEGDDDSTSDSEDDTVDEDTDPEDFSDKTQADYVKISNGPVAGAFTYGSNEQKSTTVRYVEKETGHIYEYDLSIDTSERISNQTIPRVQEVLWADEDRLVIRYSEEEGNNLKTYRTEIVEKELFDEVTGTSTIMVLEGNFLEDGIGSVTISPDGDDIFYMIDGVGYRTGFGNQDSSQTYSSYIGEWLPAWVTSGSISLTTKPSSGIQGYSYRVSSSGSNNDSDLIKIIGPEPGLMTSFGESNSNLLYSISSAGDIETYILNSGNGERVGVNTLADKCTWSLGGNDYIYCAVPNQLPSNTNYPDDWYKGYVSFSDTIFQVDPETGSVSVLFDPLDQIRERIDAINLSTNDDGSALIFTNKRTGALWLVNIPENNLIF